jgi:phosphate transport system permease protein
MSTITLILLLLAASSVAFHFGRRRALQLAGGRKSALHSLPHHYGVHTAIWCALPALILMAVWSFGDQFVVNRLVVSALPADLQQLPPERLNLLLNDVRNLVEGNITSRPPDETIRSAADHYRSLKQIADLALWLLVLLAAIVGTAVGWRRISPHQRARNGVERVVRLFLIGSSTIAIITTIGIVLSVLFESIRFFSMVPVSDFLFGLEWSPQIALREDQVGSSGLFGAVPLLAGTLLISAIALLVAVPTGLLSALYLSEYAGARLRAFAKPLLEILAGIPTVVYGFFAALTVAPLLREYGSLLGLDVASESALAAGLVMGIMIIPFVSSLSDDVLNAVPQSLRDGAYGLGATRSETIRRVIIPAALPGIIGGILLAASRAIGETMIVVMAAGLSANLTVNPLETVTTITVQIVTLLVGDQEFDSPKTLAAFALGLMLFVVTLVLNIVALHVVRRYREQYE